VGIGIYHGADSLALVWRAEAKIAGRQHRMQDTGARILVDK
jgi:hypothetical protein